MTTPEVQTATTSEAKETQLELPLNPQTEATEKPVSQKTFQDEVNETVNSVRRDANNKLVFDANTPANVKYAVTTEIRRRDTQSEYSKAVEAKTKAEEENKILKDKLASQSSSNITQAESEKLAELKYTDPDKWLSELRELEARNKETRKKELEEILKVSAQESNLKAELASRQIILQEFQDTNPDIAVSDDEFATKVPYAIHNKLKTGEISFEAFLKQAKPYLENKVALKTPTELSDQPNLSKVGGANPNEVENQSTNYEKVTV